jgi:hypothetical protein
MEHRRRPIIPHHKPSLLFVDFDLHETVRQQAQKSVCLKMLTGDGVKAKVSKSRPHGVEARLLARFRHS